LLDLAPFAHNALVSSSSTPREVSRSQKGRIEQAGTPQRHHVRGKRVPSFGGEFVLIRISRFKTAATTKASEQGRVLVRRAGAALKKARNQ